VGDKSGTFAFDARAGTIAQPAAGATAQ
jgi:hypothetical protein